MEKPFFHHPDWSFPVVRRQVILSLIDGLGLIGTLLFRPGRALFWGGSFPNEKSYRMAMYRLRKAGLIAYRREGKDPVLHLTEAGEQLLPVELHPERRWNRKWNRIWYLLVYDVPEKQRRYRLSLQRFLGRMRMGHLQDSVYASAFDVRPEFADLSEAAAVDEYAFLFEAHTVLGLPAEAVVRRTWNFDRLRGAQTRFIRTARFLALEASAPDFKVDRLQALGWEATEAYLRVMAADPLLPRALWPAGYRGPEVVEAYRTLQRIVAARR